MPRYRVTIEENASYEVEVEADNEEDAGGKAELAFLADIHGTLPCEVHEREVGDIELIEGET